VDDIISQGEDRRPPGWRRRLAIVAGVVAVAALVVVEHFPHGLTARHHPTGAIKVTANGRQIHVQYGGGVAIIRLRAEGPGTVPLPPPLTGILGKTASWPGGARIPRTGAEPTWFWPATGRAQAIRGLPDDRFGYLFTRVDGGWAIQPDPIGPPGCGGCAGMPPVPVYYLADRASTVTMVGSANQVAPAATSGALWLIDFHPNTGRSNALGITQEFSGSGRPIGPAIRLPRGYVISQATGRGLLLAPLTIGGEGTSDELWDAATGRVIRRFSDVLAASPDEIAYTPRCGTTCVVRLYEVTSGRDLGIVVGPGRSVASGAFSPDGQFLALQVSSDDDGGGLAMRLEVASTASGQLTSVPGTFVSSDALDGFGWPGPGDDLVAELTFATRVQIAFWDAARSRLSVAVVAPDQEPTALVP
jgi:hypothetical protein